ncbi:hypothetical protein AB4263_02480 [Vibrio sp. 10N.261.55.C5]|uniref:hypothetical protein n=1 Tax=Vibrio sp. 10N.261.55.C5 TaxID=3229689 RepID=UPI0035500658
MGNGYWVLGGDDIASSHTGILHPHIFQVVDECKKDVWVCETSHTLLHQWQILLQ